MVDCGKRGAHIRKQLLVHRDDHAGIVPRSVPDRAYERRCEDLTQPPDPCDGDVSVRLARHSLGVDERRLVRAARCNGDVATGGRSHEDGDQRAVLIRVGG